VYTQFHQRTVTQEDFAHQQSAAIHSFNGGCGWKWANRHGGSHLCVKQNWYDVAGSMQDTFNADAFGTYRVKNQVLPKRHHADTFNNLVAQGGGFWHSRNFDAQFPNFSNKRNSAGWIVTGDIVAVFFEIEFGKRGKNALHGLPMFRS
jgi:hypothetical protein